MPAALTFTIAIVVLVGGYSWCENLIYASKKWKAMAVALASSTLIGVGLIVESYSIAATLAGFFASACAIWGSAWVGTGIAFNDLDRWRGKFRRWLNGE